MKYSQSLIVRAQCLEFRRIVSTRMLAPSLDMEYVKSYIVSDEGWYML